MINIMYAGNDKTFDGIMLSLLSIIKYHKQPLNVYILTMDCSDKNPTWTSFTEEHKNNLQDILQEVNQQSKITIVDTGEIYSKTLNGGKNHLTMYTPYCMLRLFADQVEGMPDKVLYLDYDTVACKDIQELWDIDVSEYEYAGALDYYGRFFIARDYINSGVLLMNIKKIKETGLFKKCVELLKVKKYVLPDQTALHKKVEDKLIIDRKYNEQHRVYSNTIIRHFSATVKFFPVVKKQNIKLWHIDKVHNILKEHFFDDILEKWQQIKQNLEQNKVNNKEGN